MSQEYTTDVIVIGSGFGGAVAALRFAEAGERVVVLERGKWVGEDDARPNADWFWMPERGRFGINDVRRRGDRIVPWLGSGVGGGSHVFAGTLKRCDDFTGYPQPIRDTDMSPYYERAETMMEATPYPSHAPYGACPATRLMLEAGAALDAAEPGLVEDRGLVKLAISFAPEGVEPGSEFVNRHGATQRYAHPGEQSLLGGDIGAKNSLDRNYLFLAQRHGAEIWAMCEVDRIEPLPGGAGYEVHYGEWLRGPDAGGAHEPGERIRGSLTARRVVLAAGSIGSTEMLLCNRDVLGTLPDISGALGTRYTTNGDTMNLIVPFRGMFVAWLGFVGLIAGLVSATAWLALLGLLVYYVQLWFSRPPAEPDIGTTNSDFVRVRGPDGEPGAVYIESGRYPTPLHLGAAMALSALGLYRPRRYQAIVRVSRWLALLVPPFGALARMWPIPLLQMGRDKAYGTMRLHQGKRLVIDYDVDANREYYRHLDQMGKKLAKAAKAVWLPNPLYRAFGTLEIPHNQGGAPMGTGPENGVVDHAGRVFGYDNLMVLDGSIMPVSPGPNPALTIMALAERAMEVVVAQIAESGDIRPSVGPLG